MTPTRVSPAEIKQRLDMGEPVLFLDTRNPAAWDESSIKIPGAYRVHYSELKKHISKLPRDRIIVPYCTCLNEASSARAAQIILNHGFKKVYPLKGGFDAWLEAGYPLAPKE